jgi:hypothetical protein
VAHPSVSSCPHPEQHNLNKHWLFQFKLPIIFFIELSYDRRIRIYFCAFGWNKNHWSKLFSLLLGRKSTSYLNSRGLQFIFLQCFQQLQYIKQRHYQRFLAEHRLWGKSDIDKSEKFGPTLSNLEKPKSCLKSLDLTRIWLNSRDWSEAHWQIRMFN